MVGMHSPWAISAKRLFTFFVPSPLTSFWIFNSFAVASLTSACVGSAFPVELRRNDFASLAVILPPRRNGVVVYLCSLFGRRHGGGFVCVVAPVRQQDAGCGWRDGVGFRLLRSFSCFLNLEPSRLSFSVKSLPQPRSCRVACPFPVAWLLQFKKMHS